MRVSERNIHDPVPKNASKFPIHQTYLTTDALGNSDGSYKFKCPEVWSSARSGKKSIAIRSIRWLSKTIELKFIIFFDYGGSDAVNFKYHNSIPANMCLTDVLNDIQQRFAEWCGEGDADRKECKLVAYFDGDSHKVKLQVFKGEAPQNFRITSITSSTACSQSFNIWLNQPKNYFPAAATSLIYENVWDRCTPLNFHASFVPFDNYQYLGAIFDNWNNPIIYQDANASPLFNIWITTDMKTRLNLLYEQFIFRFTFIIDVDDQYHA